MYEDEEDELEQLELETLKLASQLMAKGIMLKESAKVGAEIAGSIDEHGRELEREAVAREAEILRVRGSAAELRVRAAQCREKNTLTAVRLDEHAQSLEAQLSNVRRREREALAARVEIATSGREHLNELKEQLTAVEAECARLQVKVGKFELEAAPFARMQQQFDARKAQAEADAAAAAAAVAVAPAAPVVEPTAAKALATATSQTAPAPAPAPATAAIPPVLMRTPELASSRLSAPRPAPKPATDRQGYLSKLSPVWLVGFQRRFFYLEGGAMKYFKQAGDRAAGLLPLGEVPLAELRGVGALLGELVVRDGRRIRIKAKSRTYELEAAAGPGTGAGAAAEGEAEAEAWLQAILATIRAMG